MKGGLVFDIVLLFALVNIPFGQSLDQNASSIQRNKVGSQGCIQPNFVDKVGEYYQDVFPFINPDSWVNPIISNVTVQASDPLDTNPLFGWVNITVEVTDDVYVSDVRLNVTSPIGSMTNDSMNTLEEHTYYCNTTFTQYGSYHFFIWASDIEGYTSRSESYSFMMPPNWDVNMDGVCDLLDLIYLSNHYGETGPNGWIREDVDNDGEVNILDLVLVSNHYEEQWSQAPQNAINNGNTPRSTTIISIDPPIQAISTGENFTVNVSVTPGQSMKGLKLQLSFDASLVQVNFITQGNLFGNFTTYFNPGTLDNSQGEITHLYDLIVGQGNITTPGTFMTVSCTAGSLPGSAALSLHNVGAANETSYVPITVQSGSVEITPNSPPYTPSSPSPPDGTNGVNLTETLSWTGGDPDPNDTVTYDVYFGTSNPPPQIINNQTSTSYTPGVLEYSTTYYWKILAWDNHGASTIGPVWDFTTIVDTTPPQTTIAFQGIIGDNHWYVGPVLVTLTATDSQSGMNTTFYKLDGSTWMNYTAPFTVSTDANHTVLYYSVDDAGNEETTNTAYLKIDQTPPVTTHNFSGLYGDDGWYISLTPVIIAYDNTSGVNHTYIKLHGGDPWMEYTSGPLIIGDGTYELYYYSVDKAGNEEQMKGPFPFKLDKTPPSIALAVTPENLQKTKWLFNVTTFDVMSGISKVEFYVDDLLQGTVTTYPYNWHYEGEGSTAMAIAYDNAGNSASSPIVTCQDLTLQSSSEAPYKGQHLAFPKLIY